MFFSEAYCIIFVTETSKKNEEPIRADIERNHVLEDEDHQFGHLERLEAERVAAEEEEREAERRVEEERERMDRDDIVEDPPIEDIEEEPVRRRPDHIVARDPDMVELVRRLADKTKYRHFTTSILW